MSELQGKKRQQPSSCPKGWRPSAIIVQLRQITYKAQRRDANLVVADRWFPSSKTCSACGVINADLSRQATWPCPSCHTTHDRNIKAAHNLHNLALLAVGENVTLPDGTALACSIAATGETVPDEGRTKPVTLANTQLSLAL